MINFGLEFEKPFQPEMNEQFETNSLADFEDENGDIDDCTDDDESRIANLEKFAMDHEYCTISITLFQQVFEIL